MGKQIKKMQRQLTNFLFFTILICVHISINTKNLKSSKNRRATNNYAQDNHEIRPTTQAPQKRPNLPTSTHVDPVEPLRPATHGPETRPLPKAPIAKNKFTKKSNKPARKVTAPKKNKKLGQNKARTNAESQPPRKPGKTNKRKAKKKKKKKNNRKEKPPHQKKKKKKKKS